MTGADSPSGPLDVPVLSVLAQRAASHPLVDGCSFEPDSISPRELRIDLSAAQYPPVVDAARLDVRWFETDQYTVHYVETREDGRWQCRWDRHPKPDAPTAHYHPPPDASASVEPSPLDGTHHLDVLFAVLDWVRDRVQRLHE